MQYRKSVSGIAQSMIKKAYRRINLLLEGYLFAKYGEMTKETYYDGVSLLLQDGRTFLVKSVKDAAVSELLVTLSVIGICSFGRHTEKCCVCCIGHCLCGSVCGSRHCI